jgi:hypothetical protein
MKKHYAKTYADAHNHFTGILSIDAIKVMLSKARIQWDSKEWAFEKIPTVLVPNANKLFFSDDSRTNDNGWIDCLDVLSRLIVFSVIDIKSKRDDHISKAYHDIVKDLLFLDIDNDQSDKRTPGRGMNSAGLLLAGCITIRCLIDSVKPTENAQKNLDLTEKYFEKLQSLGDECVDMGGLFKATCFTGSLSDLREEDWLFNKIRDAHFNPQLQAYAEQIAVACVTSALATSLWAPFDDNYAIKGLLRKGEQNKINYYMLTLRWLLEKEAIRGNYFSEISINLGDLKEVYEIIKKNANNFGFKKVTTGGVGCEHFLPLILENDDKKLGVTHNNKLYLRFLTGALNTNTVKWDVNIEEAIKTNVDHIAEDQLFGCWAGIDMFGVENFVYDRGHFGKWLTAMYERLREINRVCHGKRRLWLRPHVGEGSWADDLSVRIKRFDGTAKSLAKKLKTLTEFFESKYIDHSESTVLNEVLEFIYRSIFTGWFPIDSVRAFYGGKVFTTKELQRLSSTLQPVDPSKSTLGEEIGTANLEIMIDWLNDISPQSIEQFDKNYPQIRFGHGTHLGFDKVWGNVTDIQSNSFMPLWVDLNLGSNAITAAVHTNQLISNVNLRERMTHELDVKQAVKVILDELRFTCGYIQTEMVERSERVAKFIDLLQKYSIRFVLGTDGQGSELTSLFREQTHFNQLTHWYYKDSNDAESVNNRLKINTIEYIKYALGSLTLHNKLDSIADLGVPSSC